VEPPVDGIRVEPFVPVGELVLVRVGVMLSVSLGDRLRDGMGGIHGVGVRVSVSVGETVREGLGVIDGVGLMVSVSVGELLRD
jgi:hypothetical protein